MHVACRMGVPFWPENVARGNHEFLLPQMLWWSLCTFTDSPECIQSGWFIKCSASTFFFLCSLSIQSHTECFSDCSAVVAWQAKAQTVCNCKWHDCTRKCGTFPFGIELKFIMFVPIDLSNLCIFDFWNAQGKKQMKNARVRNVRALEEEKGNRPLFLEADI